MKYIILSAWLMLNILAARAQQFESVRDRTGKQMLKGFVTDSLLKADTVNFGWYPEHYRVYHPADSLVKTFSDHKAGLHFLVFFGTWCADSHYVIPRFFHLLDAAGIDKSQITLFALDRTKKDAAHFASSLNILHVPTIIVLREGRETGRVVEYGKTGSFDRELAAIVRQN